MAVSACPRILYVLKLTYPATEFDRALGQGRSSLPRRHPRVCAVAHRRPLARLIVWWSLIIL
jgi:hypothetical protein